MINDLKTDLKNKQEQYKDDSKLYDRFVPNIIACVEDLEIQNARLLESKVRFVIPVHNNQYIQKIEVNTI